MKHIYGTYAILSIYFFIPANTPFPLSHTPGKEVLSGSDV